MMNMMTGAVAINGGVGVMEIHQPQVAVSQMAASAAQAAEQVALNAHITLRELKTKIDTVVEKKLPTFKTLMEKEPVAVAQTMVNGAKLTTYENGINAEEQEGILKYLIEGGDLSLYGLSNAVTRASQDVVSYDRATTLEGIGWQVATMEPQQWKQINQ